MKKILDSTDQPKGAKTSGGRAGAAHMPPAYGLPEADSPVAIQRKKKDDERGKKKPVQRKAKEEDPKKKRPIQRKKKSDEELKKQKPIQRKAQPGGSPLLIDAPDSPLEKEADAVAERVVQQMSASGAKQSPFPVSRTAATADGTGALQAPPYVATELESSRGQGHSLPGHLRPEMEAVIGTDLGGVRLHTDARAAELSEAVNAQAFTYGQDVYFNRGMYQPGTVEGRRLLGHELGHVGQRQDAYRRKIAIHKKERKRSPKYEKLKSGKIVSNISYQIDSTLDNKEVEKATKRILQTSSGKTIISDLETEQFNIYIFFTTSLDQTTCARSAEGCFEEVGNNYYIYIVSAYKELSPVRTSDRSTDLFSQESIVTKDFDTISKALFHELLHVWFVYNFPGEGSGHNEKAQDPYKDESNFHPSFVKKLKKYDLDIIKIKQKEKIHRKLKEQQQVSEILENKPESNEGSVHIGRDGVIWEYQISGLKVRRYIYYDEPQLKKYNKDIIRCKITPPPLVKGQKDKIVQLSDLIYKFNRLIPVESNAYLIKNIFIYKSDWSFLTSYEGVKAIVISNKDFEDSTWQDTVAHEASHALIRMHAKSDEDSEHIDLYAQKIQNLYDKLRNTPKIQIPKSKFDPNHPPKIVEDENGQPCGLVMVMDTLWSGSGGHPWDGPQEFFASVNAGLMQKKSLLIQIVEYYEKKYPSISTLADEMWYLMEISSLLNTSELLDIIHTSNIINGENADNPKNKIGTSSFNHLSKLGPSPKLEYDLTVPRGLLDLSELPRHLCPIPRKTYSDEDLLDISK